MCRGLQGSLSGYEVQNEAYSHGVIIGGLQKAVKPENGRKRQIRKNEVIQGN